MPRNVFSPSTPVTSYLFFECLILNIEIIATKTPQSHSHTRFNAHCTQRREEKKRASMKINFHPNAERKTLESGRSQRRDYNFQFDHDWIGLNSIQYSWHNQSNVTDRILISESNRVNANDTLWLLFDRVCAREKKTIRPIVNKMKWF